jgi:hypothetical protein
MYSSEMIQVCGSRAASLIVRRSDLAWVRLFIISRAPSAASTPRLQHERRGRARHQQQQRADHGPVPATEPGHRERVRQPQQRADRGRDGGQQELLRRVEAVRRAHEQHEHRPQAPDREADVLGQDGEQQVALRRGGAARRTTAIT